MRVRVRSESSAAATTLPVESGRPRLLPEQRDVERTPLQRRQRVEGAVSDSASRSASAAYDSLASRAGRPGREHVSVASARRGPLGPQRCLADPGRPDDRERLQPGRGRLEEGIETSQLVLTHRPALRSHVLRVPQVPGSCWPPVAA